MDHTGGGGSRGGEYSHPLRIPSTYIPRYRRKDEREEFRIDRTRPSGLIKKYPNYEPFHPPPREDFQYPEYMKPTNKIRRRRSRSGSGSRHHSSRSLSRSPRDHRHYKRYSDGDGERREGGRRTRMYHEEDNHYQRSSRSGRRRRHDSRSSRSASSDYQRRRQSRDHSAHSSRSRSRSKSKTKKHASPGSDDMEKTKGYWLQRESGEEDSEVDLEQEVQPLSHYVHSRKRLLREAVRSLKGKRLGAMIPPIIKDMSISTLYDECINALEGMDEETILDVIDGKMVGVFDKEKEVPSAADAAEVNEAEPKEKEISTKRKKKKIKAEVSKKAKLKKKKQTESKKKKEAATKKKKEAAETKKKKEAEPKKKKRRKSATATDNTSFQKTSKSLMELLELEYRAKAIKALLKTQGVTGLDIDDAVGGTKENQAQLTDLTRAGHMNAQGSKQQIITPAVDASSDSQPELAVLAETKTKDKSPEVRVDYEEDEDEALELWVEDSGAFLHSESPLRLPPPPEDEDELWQEVISEECQQEVSIEVKEVEVEVEKEEEEEACKNQVPPCNLDLTTSADQEQQQQLIATPTSSAEPEPLVPDVKETNARTKTPEQQRVVEDDDEALELCVEDSGAFLQNDSPPPRPTEEELEKEVSGKVQPRVSVEPSSPPPITWYERWFQSKSMQKVVKTNNIQKKLRKKLKKNARDPPIPKQPPDMSKDADGGLPIIGSIEEYEKLFGKKPPQPPVPVNCDIDKEDGEESGEDEAELWGDIIGDD